MKALLISTYDLGHQPFGLASPAAWLTDAGAEVRCVDLSMDTFEDGMALNTDLVAIHVPMHTATRLAESVITRVKNLNPDAHICCFGLYASVNADWLQKLGAHSVIGGEFEQPLVELCRELSGGAKTEFNAIQVSLGKQQFQIPDRHTLPSLDRYGGLIWPDGHSTVVGYTEASRGCKHVCRHCPVVPVYGGQFRIVQREIVMADIRQLVAQGAGHITFGDPDFFNGPGHAMAVVQALHNDFPELTYDVIIKIEHLLAHARHLPVLKKTGCLFITSAVESVEDDILVLLDKGHTRADFIKAAALCHENDLHLSPTFIPFTPWTTIPGFIDLLATVHGLGLVDSLAPIQLAIRLLVPGGSRLRELEQWHTHEGGFDEAALSYTWAHPDPAVEELYAAVRDIVAASEEKGMERRNVFTRIWNTAHDALGNVAPALTFLSETAPLPHMSEAWYCCAEPTDRQLASI